ELLAPHDTRLGPFSLEPTPPEPPGTAGVFPRGANGAELNLGFESGTLDDWSATGDAFARQPVNRDGISQRWPDQASGKQGDYFVGGFEIVRDQGLGRLVSSPFRVTHPYASFLIGGGNTRATRVEVFRPAADGAEEKVLFEAMGQNREAMRRVVADLRSQIGQTIAVRLIDDSRGGWGHLNFDDFRFHDEPPAVVEHYAAWRSTRNPVLAHLVPNPSTASAELPGGETTAQMMVPRGFSVDVIAAEPELHQPMAFTFDARGRLWVAEGHCYPQKRPDGQGLDCILIFTDHDGNGSFEHRQVFAEGLNLVSGLEVGMGGVWVGAAPELLFIPDRDGDDRPDSAPEVRLDGFGFADTHETLNSFLWGPDGWLYGNQGVFNRSLVGKPGAPDTERQAMQAGVWRYHPIRRVFEVFAQGGSNQWGLDYDEHGQLFMTHCRSRWGEGLTTHVMQGGHYWNQVNSGYAPFISATPLRDQPALRNYLLASARYGHGEGGAGKPGSGQVYGGHSHVGTLIYLGDNWPAELRNHLFTHNLHGHQLNHQINLREAGGYNTVHAGHDLLFCADPQYIGVDLQTGPDGAVYISDWYDPRHCHNPNVEHWDRGNGRIYRMKFDATYTPARADYVRATDEQLVAAQLHRNDWHVRAARLELSYRASTRPIATVAVQRLRELAMQHSDADRRLRALWALHGIGAVDPPLVEKLLADGSEYVRGWTVQLAIESLEIDAIRDQLLTLASSDDSLLVRRYLASALPRVPSALGWQLAATLVAQPENAADRDLPLLLWYGVASLMQDDVPRAMKLGDTQCLPVIRDYLDWYAAKISAQGRADLTDRLAVAEGSELRRLLSLFELAVRGMRNLEPPPAWSTAAERLYELPAPDLRRASATIGAAFSDERLFQRQRALVADSAAPLPDRQFALSLLAYDPSSQNLPIYLQLLDSPLAPSVVPLLSQYADTSIAPSLIDRLASGGSKLREPVLETLSSRPAWASQLLDAINRGQVDKRLLNAYYARQMSSLGDAA
ncbi:MAG: PVC-type heme-binding CxxCH protein, partial [Pirellulaceae bacterium]